MSLLDDVSIVVTPNGYKAGELYAVIPVPTEGSEEVTNGDFDTDSDWNKGTGWTISGGTANCDGTQSGNTDLRQNVTTDTGKQYKITYTVSNYSAGNIFIRLNSGNITSTKSSNGTFSEILSGSGGTQVILRANLDFIGSVDNVSVKEYTSADMDVTRATAATRVDEDGLVNYAEVVTGSDIVTDGDFPDGSTAWALNGWTISGNTANGNGLTANLIQSISGSANKNFSLTFTISNYISGSVIPAFVGNSSDSLVYSSNGTFTEVISSGSDIRFVFYGASFSGSISNVSVKEVTRDNVPRIDYTGGGCPHILAEPQRTNLLPYSEDFSEWIIQSGITLTTNTTDTLSPSGLNNASKIVSTDNTKGLFLTPASTTSAVTRTIYLKGSVGGESVTLKDGGGYGGTVTHTLTTEWARYEFKTTNDGNTYKGLYVDDISVGTIYAWGAQLEEGSYATSYIPTSGSTVTRNQDIFSRDGIGSLINSTEGVLFVEMAALSNDLTARRISINDGSYNNIVEIGYTSGTNEIKNRVKSGGGTQANMNFTATDILDDLKIALKWKVNDFAVWVNGVEVVTETSGATPIGLSQISFDRGDGTQNYFGKVKQLQVYTTALTDTQLAALTS